MTLKDLKLYIGIWDTVRNTELGFNLLSPITYFKISRHEYENWTSSSSTCYMYLGVEGNMLFFYLCSNLLEDIDDIKKQVIQCAYPQPGDALISESEAKKRIARWQAEKRIWFDQVSVEGEVVMYFLVPEEDLNALMSDPKNHHIYFYPALNTDSQGMTYIELILANGTEETATEFYDVTKPRPPF